MKIHARVRNLKTKETQEIILQDILKSYIHITNDASVQNFYEIDGELWAVYRTLFKNEREFEQILIPKESLFRGELYHAYHLKATIKDPCLRTYKVFNVSDDSLITDNLKLIVTPFSFWDFIVIDEFSYQFNYVSQTNKGELKLFVGDKQKAYNFWDTYNI